MCRARIRELNDRFRRCRQGNGRVVMSAGLNALGPVVVAEACAAVRSFDGFTPDNDPYGEHDFGALVVRGQRIFWKIDYLDPTLTFGSENPTDETLTCRVLTIMLAQDT